MPARYICIEGTEGVGKTTQTQKLYDYLRSKGHSVLLTKEPGTAHCPITIELRNIMLNAKYDAELTLKARELISQAIRSIHLEKVIVPALNKYDYIVQDRGILSGMAYGSACGNPYTWIEGLSYDIVHKIGLPLTAYEELHSKTPYTVYDNVIYLVGDVHKGLEIAKKSKQEFEAGDAIEMKGAAFMDRVSDNMNWMSKRFPTTTVDVRNKTIEQVFADILEALKSKETIHVKN